MNPHEVLNFLLPQLGDPLQMGFLAIILAMIVGTIVSAHLTANERSWERKWNRGTPDDKSDDLDIEHGSVTDLWHAVATTPEKLAEIMPSMLLVIGLLGTFLGLGIALNHASNILGQPDAMSANGAAQSMKDLVGLLQGLGTKFKTSTWGISGFVLIKFWSELTRFPEKRLAWVIGKVKTELESRKRTAANAEQARQNALFAQISEAAQGIVDGFAAQTKHMLDQQRGWHTDQQAQDDARVALLRKELDNVRSESRTMNATMTDFTSGVAGVVEKMADAAERTASGADQIGNAADGLTSTVEAFNTQFTEVLNEVRTDLGTAIENMSRQASDTFERGSRQMEGATQQIAKALEGLSADVTNTMVETRNSIADAQKVQNRASTQFTTMSDTLNANIESTTNMFEVLTKKIEAGLESVSSNSRGMTGIGKSLEKNMMSIDAVVEQLAALPPVLTPLAKHGTEQRRLLEPLGALPSQQQAILRELQEIHSALGAVADAVSMARLPDKVDAGAQPDALLNAQ